MHVAYFPRCELCVGLVSPEVFVTSVRTRPAFNTPPTTPPLSHSPSTTPPPSEHIFRPLGNESLVFIEGGHCKRSTELMGEKLFLTKTNQIYDLIQNTFYYYLLIDWHIFNVYILRRKLAQLQCMYYGGPNLMSNCTVFNCIHVYLIIAGCRMFNI